MLTNLLRAGIIALVLYIVYLLVSYVVVLLGLPGMITIIVGVIMLIWFCIYLLRLFGISL